MEKLTNVDRILLPNLKLSVSLVGINTIVYDSRIEEIAYNTFFIATPSDKGMPMPSSPGAKLDISFINGGGRYFFKTVVTNKIMSNINLLEVKKPDVIFKSEYREFFRIPVLQKVRINILKEVMGRNMQKTVIPDKAIDGVCINVSGGGLKFLVEHEINLETLVEMDLGHFIEGLGIIRGKIVRSIPNHKGMYEIGINYLDLKDSQRDKIIKYTFQRQIEMRKMEKK